MLGAEPHHTRAFAIGGRGQVEIAPLMAAGGLDAQAQTPLGSVIALADW